MLSTVVGNFPKIGDSQEKQKLRRGIESYQQEKIALEELERIEDEVTREIVEEQIGAGIYLITDGQIRWQDPLTWPVRKLKGISINGLTRFFDNNVYYRRPVVESAVGWVEPLVVRDFQFLRKAVTKKVAIKAVLPGPYTLARLCKNKHYGRFEDLVMDFARALAQEVKALEEAGASYIQFDEPSIPFYPENFKMAAKAFEICTTPVSEAEISVYTYFAGVSRIFPDFMNLPVDVLGLDLVSGQDNIPLLREKRFVKNLALGIVDARNTRMEKEEDLRSLLQSFEKNSDRIQYVNPSCGLEFLPYDIAVRKLQLVGSLAAKEKEMV